ncbi:spore germination protein [Bacillus cereus]|uniref:Spore germination protein n=9 Tax=Bacillus cereus group TaxID=86661 RepID=A0A643MHU7_BACTU|nr:MULTISPECIES: spore germination protein [Bacillus cereus group]AGE80619.1 spore germination protein gerIA [Bacillus thuringiensis serovar kurstaki str. HD73]AHZ53576.1 spore germination protein gerIA [Bacillus thuringiensis serovar kurstaki str. YBT-1520]AIM29603.1 spore germination protein gerIA [Bacillus thuringiensis serovar kurstaki str. YBT-1520]AJK41071.1 GerA spore germination family protein [Bacillus thuringiensis serovar kurstaki]EJQ18034.1 spore germination protein gerIA [Bacillus
MIWNWLRKKKKLNKPEANERDNQEQHSNNEEDDNKEQTRSIKHNKGKNNEQKDSSQDKQQSAKQDESSQDKQQSSKQDESSQDKQQSAKQNDSFQDRQQSAKQDDSSQDKQQSAKQDDSSQDKQQKSKRDESSQDKQQSAKQNDSSQDRQQSAKQDDSFQDKQQSAKQDDSFQDKQQSSKQDDSFQDKQQSSKQDDSSQDRQQSAKQDDSSQDKQQSAKQGDSSQDKQQNAKQDEPSQSKQQSSGGNSIYDFTKPEKDRIHSLQDLIEKLKKSSDFINYHTSDDETMPYWISYYRPSLDGEKLQKYLMPTLLERPCTSLEELKEHIPMSGITITNDLQKIEDMVLKGHAIIQLNQQDQKCMLANIAIDNYRAPTPPLNESTVIGPQEGFVEAIDTNINLVRKRLPVLDLQTKEMIIGEFSKTKVVMMYLDNLAEKDNVDFLEESLRALEYDQINDSAYIQELMGEKSIFPLYINTERTDRVTKALIDGKIAIFVDGSPSVLLTPVSYFDFFISPEDYNVSWMYATFSRVLRLIAVLFSICATPLYVAVLNYHYELIPSDLLETLILSRAQVPFPPLIEALFLELAIDLLREAGARLPMKVGQTLGIVGGIVIGQASVQAGLTSNILLIIVALSALASFITPIYKMGNAVRLLRFPFLIFAEIGGLFGISLGFIFLFTHLFRLTSLRKPYALFYPTRQQSVKDSWIRFPLTMIDTRDVQARPQHVKKAAKGISTKHRSDFDD